MVVIFIWRKFMKTRIFIALLFLSITAIPNVSPAQPTGDQAVTTQVLDTTQAQKKIDWLLTLAITTLRNEGYTAEQVKIIIQELLAAIKGGLDVKDIANKDQILTFAKAIIRTELQGDNEETEAPIEPGQAEWLSVVTVLKRAGYTAEQIKTIVKALQEKGTKVQDFQNDEQILAQAKAIIDGDSSYKWKIVAGVSAVVAIVVIGALFYFKYKNDELRARIKAITDQYYLARDEITLAREENTRLRGEQNQNNNQVQNSPLDREHATSSNKICAICWEGGREGIRLGCGHDFHLPCINQWFQHKATCPTCRADSFVNLPNTN